MANGAETWARHLPRDLVVRFTAARRRVRKVILVKGGTLVVFAACLSFGLSVILDRLFFLRSPYRMGLFVGSIAAISLFLVRFLLVPLSRRLSARRIAQGVEEKHPELGDMLLSAVELSEQLETGETYTSKQLVSAVSEEAARRTRAIDFRSILPFSSVGRALVGTLAVVCGVGVYCYLHPTVAENVLRRILFPYSGPPPLTFTQLKVTPGNALVLTGTDVEIKAITAGRIPGKAFLYLKGHDAPGGQEGWDKKVLRGKTKGEFQYRLSEVLRPISYRLKAGDARSETYTVSVTEAPVIVGVEVDYTYPDYTARPPEKKAGSGDVAAVRGTKVRIAAKANKPLKTAQVRFGDETQSLVFVRDETIRSQEFEIKKDESYSFHLVDTYGFANTEAITYGIRALEDRPPVVGIRSPEKYSDATPDAVVNVAFRAADDFGIEKIWLEYSVSGAELKEEKDKVAGDERKGTLAIEIASRGKTEVEGEYPLSLAELGGQGSGVRVGELVVFRVVAEDKNVLSGPGRGVSSEHTIRVISSESSLRKIEQEQQDLERRLQRLVNQQKENKKLVDNLTAAVRGKESPSEGEKKSLEEAKSVQRQIEEAGRQLAKDFASTLEKMRESPMIRVRSVIEMADITGALEGVSAAEMPAATKKASEASKSEMAPDRENKLRETSSLQDEIIKKLEEAGREFAKLQEGQRLLSLAETAGQLAKEQLDARTQTAAALPDLAGVFPEKLTEEQKRRLRELVEEEEKLREKLTEFEDRLRTLKKQLEYSKSADAQMIAEALKYFEQGADASSIPQNVREAIDSLRANHLNKGINNQTRAYESLMRLAQEFEQAQRLKLQGEFANSIQGLEPQESEIDKLIEIQKAIVAETKQLPLEKIEGGELQRFEKVSASEKDLLRRTSNFRAILEEIFENLVLIGIDPVTPLKGAEETMGKASGSLEKLKPETALSEEAVSLQNLEKAREELAKALARMMAGASLQQAMQAMSALEKMIQEQRKVNEDTANLDKESNEKKEMTDPMLEALRQLADQQARLKDRANAMRNYLKMMPKAGEMMGDSENKLRNRQTGQQTQQVQGQILELLMQMLVKLQMDASAMAQAAGLPGSSGTGAHGGVVTEPILTRVPESTDDRWSKLPPRMKQELLEAWTEKFSPEFRELIALYYKRLSGGQPGQGENAP